MDNNNQTQTPQQPADSNESSNSGQSLTDLVDALQSVDTTTPEDNNGGRIELNEDPSDPNVIKK